MPFLLIIPNGRHWCSLLESRYPWILFNHFTDFSLSIRKLHYRKTSDITGDITGDIQGLGKVDKVYLDNSTTIPKYTFEVGGKRKNRSRYKMRPKDMLSKTTLKQAMATSSLSGNLDSPIKHIDYMAIICWLVPLLCKTLQPYCSAPRSLRD